MNDQFITSFPTNMSKTFPEHSHKRCSVVLCWWHVSIFSEQHMVSLFYTVETVKKNAVIMIRTIRPMQSYTKYYCIPANTSVRDIVAKLAW